MLPWPPPWWCAGEEEVPEVPDPLEGSDQGEAWSSGEEALGEPRTPLQDSLQHQALRSSWTQRGQLQTEQLPPCHHLRLIPDAEHSLRPSVPLSPQMIREVAPSRMTLLAPWDPNYQAKAGPRLVWGASCGSGASFSGRTLCHPSFWPLYEASSSVGVRPRTFRNPGTGPQNGEWAVQDTGFSVMCREDVFLCDPLLPCGQRVPLYLSEAPTAGDGLPEAAAPTPCHVPLGCPQPFPELLHCLAQWARADRPHRPAADEPGGAETQLFISSRSPSWPPRPHLWPARPVRQQWWPQLFSLH
ncbi:histone deacetylase complex subunit SAP25 [Otolemur garnettii]|uniref:histone deacetylase complex subunit SAP25 n=1 Tax=Otolemur garnettii TaxID=30611 RepID=UPI0006444C88|nr:histone deacetylase complex subunit SAP25 [Otolemur garnettii]